MREISRGEFTPSWAIVGGQVGERVKSGWLLAKQVIVQGVLETMEYLERWASFPWRETGVLSRAYRFHVRGGCD